MADFLSELKRRLLQDQNMPMQGHQPVGATPPFAPRNTMEMRTGEGNPTVQGIQPPNVPVGVAEQAPQQGKVFDAVRRAVSQQPDMQGKDAVLSRTNMAPQAPMQQQGLGGDIEKEADELRRLESQPVGFWKRFGSGLLSRAITRRGDEPIPITKRQRDIQRLRGQLGRDVKLREQEAQIGGLEALRRNRELEPMFETAKLDLDRQRIAGTISEREYQREKDKIEFQQKELDRQSHEKIGAANNATTLKAAGIRAAASGDNNESLEQNIYDARQQQAKIDAVLPDLEKKLAAMSPTQEGSTKGVFETNPEYAIVAKQVNDARDERNRLDAEIRQYRARRKGTSVAASSVRSSSPPAPTGVTEQSIRADAIKKGKDPEKAVERARGFGWIK